MQLVLSLLAGFLLLNGGNAEPLTQNCGSAVCKFEEDFSCDDLIAKNTFTGTCCSLEDNTDGTCTVSVSSGICYWQPKVPCDGCAPGTGGKFLGSGNSDGCPESQYQALPGQDATDPDVVEAGDSGSGDLATEQATDAPDVQVQAADSAAASTGVAIVGVLASATMFFL